MKLRNTVAEPGATFSQKVSPGSGLGTITKHSVYQETVTSHNDVCKIGTSRMTGITLGKKLAPGSILLKVSGYCLVVNVCQTVPGQFHP